MKIYEDKPELDRRFTDGHLAFGICFILGNDKTTNNRNKWV